MAPIDQPPEFIGFRARPLISSLTPTAPPQSCLDAQLASRGLNQFGDSPDTMYPGGTPLFDEKTGKRTEREAYVFAKHPEIAAACRR